MPKAIQRAAAFAGVVCLFSVPLSAQTTPTRAPLRPLDVIEAPEQFLNRTVDVEIVESLSGVGGQVNGQFCVNLPETFSCTLSLVASDYKPDDPERDKHKLEGPIASPVRIRGEFLSDDKLTKQGHRPGYVIRGASLEPLPQETPTPVASVSELLAQEHGWDRRRVVIEGTWRRGFEISTLDREIWLSAAANAEMVGMPKSKRGLGGESRVRVTGLLYARPGRRYGHMASAAMLLLASKVEYLGPVP